MRYWIIQTAVVIAVALIALIAIPAFIVTMGKMVEWFMVIIPGPEGSLISL